MAFPGFLFFVWLGDDFQLLHLCAHHLAIACIQYYLGVQFVQTVLTPVVLANGDREKEQESATILCKLSCDIWYAGYVPSTDLSGLPGKPLRHACPCVSALQLCGLADKRHIHKHFLALIARLQVRFDRAAMHVIGGSAGGDNNNNNNGGGSNGGGSGGATGNAKNNNSNNGGGNNGGGSGGATGNANNNNNNNGGGGNNGGSSGFVAPTQFNSNPGASGAPANQAPVQQRLSPLTAHCPLRCSLHSRALHLARLMACTA